MIGIKFRAFVVYITLLITFLGLIGMIFNLHRFAFYGESLILLALVLAAIIAAIGINTNQRWAWVLLSIFFAFVFLDMIFIKLISTKKPEVFLHLLVVAIAGFFISLFSIEPKRKEAAEEKKVGEKKGAKAVEKSFKPGKYIASRTGKKFHAPKCDWAKKVKKENAVWFDSKEDAMNAGYSADYCIK